jgi:hypothetical protein
LDGHAVGGEINARVFLEALDKVADEVDIEILTAQMSVTVGGFDLKDTLLDLENGDIEGSSSQIVDCDNLVLILLKTISKGSSGRLVYDTKNIEASNLTGILGSLTLRIVEVGWDSDDGVLDWLGEICLGSLLHLSENETTNLGWRVLLSSSFDPGVTVGVLDDLVWDLLDIALNLGVGELSSDQTLCGEEGVLWVDDSLTLCRDTD